MNKIIDACKGFVAASSQKLEELHEEVSLLRVPPIARREIKNLGEPTLPVVGIAKTFDRSGQVSNTMLSIGEHQINEYCTQPVYYAAITGDSQLNLGEKIATRQLPCRTRFSTNLK